MLGVFVALSSPVSGFLSYAVLATIFGESKFEDASGPTPLGYLTLAIPAIIGLAIVAWSFTSGPLPNRRFWQIGLAIVGMLFAATGAATVGNDDPSIGGGLLVIAAFGILGGLALEAIAHRRN